MHPIFCFIGSVIRYTGQIISAVFTGKEVPKFSMVCQNKSNAWLGFLIVVPIILWYFIF
jgi:hypothetical protein